MVGSCAAFGCKNRWTRDRKRQFHRFPLNDPLRLKKWLIAIGRASWQPSKFSVLCGDHFTKDSYESRARYFLKDDAVPSIFFPPEAKKKPKKREPVKGYALAKRIRRNTDSGSDLSEPSTSTFSDKAMIDKNEEFSLDVFNTISVVYSNLNPAASTPVVSTPNVSTPNVSNPNVSNPVVSNAVVSNPVASNPIASNPIASNPIASNPIVSSCINPSQAYCLKKVETDEKPSKKDLQIKVHNLQKKLLRREQRIKHLESLLACTKRGGYIPDETESLL